MPRRLLHIALNPLFQALVVAGLVILFVPSGRNKYVTNQASAITRFDKTQFIFADLDHDRFSERIQTLYNKPGNVALALVANNAILGQWNFKGIYEHESIRLMIGDYDHDSLDEIYLFTLVSDSVFLHILEYSEKPSFIIRDRFIDIIGKTLKDPDFTILPGEVTEMNGDQTADLVFGINTGFSRQPRNVYIYDIANDSLAKSIVSGAFIGKISLVNLDDDGFKEIITSTFASANYNEEPFSFTDTSSYLMVLDHDLKFMFPPVVFPVPTSSVEVVPIKRKSGEYSLLGRYAHASSNKHPCKLFLADKEGIISREQELGIDEGLFDILLLTENQRKISQSVIAADESSGFYVIDENLNIRQKLSLKYISRNPALIDIDQDNKDEFIVLAMDQKQHLILEHDFSSVVAFDFPIQSNSPVFSVKLNGDKPPQLSVQGDQDWKLFNYGINPVYRFRFMIYLGIYLSILGFILLIRKLYSFQLKKRYETEKKITTLQLSSVKAQMEPHFIMNTINTIGSSIYRQKPDEAYQLLLNFSGMVRSLLLSSDKLTRSLQEEIDFVKNYLDLEKTRFNEVFDYSINEEEGIDPESVIPKMIIQLHAENSLKHGLIPKKSGGFLEIVITKDQEYILITITDNGVGRKASAKNIGHSTGRGMKILAQLFETYNKHNRRPLRQEIIDLYDDEQKPAGTLVKIYIPLNFNEEIY